MLTSGNDVEKYIRSIIICLEGEIRRHVPSDRFMINAPTTHRLCGPANKSKKSQQSIVLALFADLRDWILPCQGILHHARSSLGPHAGTPSLAVPRCQKFTALPHSTHRPLSESWHVMSFIEGCDVIGTFGSSRVERHQQDFCKVSAC